MNFDKYDIDRVNGFYFALIKINKNCVVNELYSSLISSVIKINYTIKCQVCSYNSTLILGS